MEVELAPDGNRPDWSREKATLAASENSEASNLLAEFSS